MNYWDKRAAIAANEESGVWVVVPAYPKWRFKVGRDSAWNERAVRAAVRIAEQPKFRDLIARTSAPDYVPTEADNALDRESARLAFAEGLLLEWQGVLGPDGKAMKCTPQNAAKLFEHFPDIFVSLRSESREAANFETVSDDEKESVAAGN